MDEATIHFIIAEALGSHTPEAPGQILREWFLTGASKTFGIPEMDVEDLVVRSGLDRITVLLILDGFLPIDRPIAEALGRALETGPDLWEILQIDYARRIDTCQEIPFSTWVRDLRTRLDPRIALTHKTLAHMRELWSIGWSAAYSAGGQNLIAQVKKR